VSELVIALADHADGVVVPVRAQPRSRRPGVQGEQGGALKLGVSAPPEDGRANAALIELLADVLGVRRSQVELLSGQTSRDKRFLIRDADRAALANRLQAALA
jgi:hypothetical protein